MSSIPVPTPSRRQLILGALVLPLVAGSIAFAAPELGSVVGEVGAMSPGWIAAAALLELASCLSFVALFGRFFGDMAGSRSRRLAWTGLASNALLPGGGVTGVAVPAYLMHSRGAPAQTIVRRAGHLFLLTGAVTVIVLVAAGVLCLGGFSGGPHDFARAGLPVLAGCVVAAVGWVAARPRAVTCASAAAAAGFLLFDVAALGATSAAAGAALPVGALVLGYLVGYLASLIPVPGGIGVVDAGLAGALVAYGAPATQAAAAVLVYHAIAFWLPAIGGGAAFAMLRRV